MIRELEIQFPKEVSFTRPEGGMFLWVTIPDEIDVMELFEIAVKQKVAFVPGHPFYVNKKTCCTLRLNFSCSDEDKIREGISRLARSIEEIMNSKRS
jgi:2-aminoadipate transaminase